MWKDIGLERIFVGFESFRDEDHLDAIVEQAQALVARAIG